MSLGAVYKYEFSFMCIRCGAVYKENGYVSPRSETPHPELPHGWKEIDGALFCPKHRLVLTVDNDKIVEVSRGN